MLFWPAALFAITLPFACRSPLFSLGALAFDLPLTTACLAVLAGLVRAIRQNPRFDALDWSAVALAGAWLLSALATPAGTAAPLATAWRWSLGPAVFVLLRRGLDPEERRFIAGLAFAGAVASFVPLSCLPTSAADRALYLAVTSALFLPLARKRRGLALATTGLVVLAMLALVLFNRPPLELGLPAGRPLLGWGAGSRPGLALFPALLADGGLVGVLAAMAFVWFGFRALRTMLRRRPRPPGTAALILVLGAFLLAGIVMNPLRSLPGALGIWLALGILLPGKNNPPKKAA